MFHIFRIWFHKSEKKHLKFYVDIRCTKCQLSYPLTIQEFYLLFIKSAFIYFYFVLNLDYASPFHILGSLFNGALLSITCESSGRIVNLCMALKSILEFIGRQDMLTQPHFHCICAFIFMICAYNNHIYDNERTFLYHLGGTFYNHPKLLNNYTVKNIIHF